MQKLVFKNGKGVEIDLTSDPYGITQWEGFSATEANIQSQQVPFNDGSVFLDALLNNRELTVTLSINDENNLEKRYRLRRELIALMNPKLGEGVLTYTNDYTSKQIRVVPSLPTIQNKNANQSGTVKASLTWTACNPYWEDVEEKTVIFDVTEQPVIENMGDVPTPIKAEMYSTKVINPTLTNLITEKKVGLNGEFTFMKVDTESGKKVIEGEHITSEYLTSNFTLAKVIYVEELEKFFAITTYFVLNQQTLVVTKRVGYVLESIDGNSWKFDFVYRQTNNIGALFDIEYNPNTHKLYLLGGEYNGATSQYTDINGYDTGTMFVSSDGGKNWTKSVFASVSTSQYVRYFIPRFILSQKLGFTNKMIIGGTDGFYYSSDNGETWTGVNTYNNHGFATSELKTCVYLYNHNGVDFYLGSAGSSIYTSTDGIDWTSRTDFGANFFTYNYDAEGCFIDTIFITQGTGIKKSSDGINWVTSPYTLKSDDTATATSFSETKALIYNPTLKIFVLGGDTHIYRPSSGHNSYVTPVFICSDKLHWECAEYISFSVEDDPTSIWNENPPVYSRCACFSQKLNLMYVSMDTMKSASSINGLIWNVKQPYVYNYNSNLGNPSISDIKDFAEGNDTIVGTAGLNAIYKKGNLTDWCIKNHILRSVKSEYDYRYSPSQIAYAKGYFYTIQDLDSLGNTSKLLRSADGKEWEVINLPVSARWFIVRAEYRNNNFRYLWIIGNAYVANQTGGQIKALRNTTIGVIDNNWTEVTTGLTNLTNLVNDMAFSEGSLGGYVVCDGGRCLRVQSGTNFWQRNIVGETPNLKSICYIKRRQCFIAVGETDATNHRAVIYKSPLINGEYSYWHKVYESTENNSTLRSCAYSEEENLVLAVGDNFVLASVGGEDWQKVTFEGNMIPFTTVFFSKQKHCFLLGGQGGLICKTKFNNTTNLIEFITDDSDMSLNLEVGENVLRLNYDEGYILCKVTYREKYLGV